MSIYFTPSDYATDEEASWEDSVYTTPTVSNDSSQLKAPRTPNITVGTVSDTQDSFFWNNENTLKSPPNAIHQKHLLDSKLDKENVGYFSAPKCPRRHSESTPLKSVTNITTPVVNTLDTITDSPIEAKKTADCRQPHGEDTKNKKPRFMQRIRFLSKSKTKCEIVEKSKISDISLHADSEVIVIRIPQRNYGSICCANVDPVPNNDLQTSDILSTPQVASGHESLVSMLDHHNTIDNALTKSWISLIRHPVASVLRKIRFSPVKRLFSRSLGGIQSGYRRYLKKSCKSQYKPLDNSVRPDSEVAERDVNESVLPVLAADLDPSRNRAYSSIINTERLMELTLMRLTSLENEVKELRSLVKDAGIRGPGLLLLPPPPPPPPPPLPSMNFVTQSATPKRKVDLTTPEYDQAAKRPSRAQEQRTQFSVTVEDLRKVKLRKTGNTHVKKIGSANLENISHSASTRGLRRSRFVKKELSEITAELLSPRKNDKPGESSLLLSPHTRNNATGGLSIYEQTPVRSKHRNSVLRSVKRKDWSGDSPVRKRLNSSSYSSPRSRNSVPENAQ